jgi:hypothetical protein
MKRSIFFPLLLLFVSCNDDKNVDPDPDIIFGHFYGETQYIEIYKITNANLLEDTSDEYLSSTKPYEGKFDNVLSDELFNKVKSLKGSIPKQLFDIPNGVIGMPDAADGGGIYLGINHNGESRFWLIDKTRSHIPEHLLPLIDEIEKSIELINN